MSTPRIVVVGSSNTDLTIFTRELPSAGQTAVGAPVVEAGGGKGANQAVAARRAGAEVFFVGRIGDDYFGRRRLAELRREGIDTEFVVVDTDAPSGMALIVVDANGENMIAVSPGANMRLLPDDVLAASDRIRCADALLVQLEVSLDAVEAALTVAAQAGLTTIMDPAPVVETGLPKQFLEKAAVLVPNRQEAAGLLGRDGDAPAEELAEALAALAGGVAILTLGSEGACVCASGGCVRVPAAQAHAVDSVGAGDCFAGALAVALASGEQLERAVAFAAAAAAVSVERQGAQPSLPTKEEILTRLDSERSGA